MASCFPYSQLFFLGLQKIGGKWDKGKDKEIILSLSLCPSQLSKKGILRDLTSRSINFCLVKLEVSSCGMQHVSAYK